MPKNKRSKSNKKKQKNAVKPLLSFKNHEQAELFRQRQWVKLFAEVTFKIRQHLKFKEILNATVTEVQRILQADRVLIYQIFPDGTGRAITESVLPNYPKILDLEFPEEVFPTEYQQLYARGRVRAIADVSARQEGLSECLIEFVHQFNIKAKMIVPILQKLTSHQQNEISSPNQLWGLLIAHHCDRPYKWLDIELELMQQLADQIGIALSQAQFLEHLEENVEVDQGAAKSAISDKYTSHLDTPS